MNEYLSEKQYRLPLMVCGVDKKPQRHINRSCGFDVYQITLVTNGNGIYIDENNIKHELKRGTVYIFAPHVKHEYFGTNDSFSTYWINFDGIGVSGIMEYNGIENSIVFDLDDEFAYSKLYLMMEDIYNSYWHSRSSKNVSVQNGIDAELDHNKYRESEMFASMTAYNLLGEIGIMMNRKKYEVNDTDVSEIAPVLAMIQKRYMENIGVSDMADCIGVSINKVASLFKKNYGITPNQFLINTRLNYAEMFLRKMNNATVKQISEMAGFSNSGYFIKVFKSKFGITPEAYREMYTKR